MTWAWWFPSKKSSKEKLQALTREELDLTIWLNG